MNQPAADLVIDGGEVRPKEGGAGIPAVALIGGKRFSLKVDPNAPLKSPLTYTTVGKRILRADVPLKCSGRPIFSGLDGPSNAAWQSRAAAVIWREAAFGDESSVRAIPDVRIESFLGVVAKDERAAVRAVRELKASWSERRGFRPVMIWNAIFASPRPVRIKSS